LLIIAVLSFGFYSYQAEPDFWLDRFYERIYADRLEPAPEVMLNGTPVFFDLTTEEWNIQKKSGQWYTPPKAPEEKVDASDDKPPAAAAHAYEDKLAVVMGKEPDRASLRIVEKDSGQTVPEEQAVLSALPLPARNGNFTYELTLEWTGESDPYRGKYVLEIPVVADLPAKFVFSGQRLSQGQLLEVKVYYAKTPEDIIFEQSIYDNFRWFQEDGFLRGYLPTNYNVKPGTYQIKYGSVSSGTEFTQGIEVAAYDYQIQYLYADPQMEQETRNDEAYAEYYKYFTPVRNQSEPVRYYTEDFILPARGRLSTEFGETRYVNDIPTSYRHLGLDIAAPEGTEVKAANRGKVALARQLILTGNTVIIDHGEGLFSVYQHMLNLSVKTGDIVERGQKVGEVGTTGFSTGPHLHFMISYYQANLEPGYFLFGQPVTYENYRELIQ
ncbi:MAG TPA: M23 family metallopeptidase, partial [Anaerovoracaceae bacterium]|nr:M23 family metallopeptidase [Anaerovoracaceae bacterium]